MRTGGVYAGGYTASVCDRASLSDSVDVCAASRRSQRARMTSTLASFCSLRMYRPAPMVTRTRTAISTSFTIDDVFDESAPAVSTHLEGAREEMQRTG
jgi:hypothetical protein